MKIQFILNNKYLYGANRSILSVIEYLHTKEGYDVNVFVPFKGTMSEALSEKNIPFSILPYYSAFLYIRPIPKHLIIPLLALWNIFVFPILLYKVMKYNPDIVYSNTSAENLGIFIAKILGKKHIWHIREFMARDYKFYFVLGKKLKSKFINWSDGSIYVSKSVLKEVHLDDDRNKIVIYNGISSSENTLMKSSVNLNEIVFGSVGVLDPAKGHHKAIYYFKSISQLLPNSKFFIYGEKEGSYKQKLIKQVFQLGLENRVIFRGFEKEQRKIYSSIDILLMFSKSEGFGRVTIEAALNGIPVIGYDNAGTSELIIDKKTGCLFKNEASFINSVKFLLSSEEMYSEIRENAFSNAYKNYSVGNYCTQVENFIIKIGTLR